MLDISNPLCYLSITDEYSSESVYRWGVAGWDIDIVYYCHTCMCIYAGIYYVNKLPFLLVGYTHVVFCWNDNVMYIDTYFDM